MTTREVVICPVCLQTIVSRVASPISSVSRMDSRTNGHDAAGMLTAMMMAANEQHAADVESVQEACRSHYRTKHRVRLWLWRKTNWQWLMIAKLPWTKLPANSELLR